MGAGAGVAARSLNLGDLKTDDIVEYFLKINPEFSIYNEAIKLNRVCGEDLLRCHDTDALKDFFDEIGVKRAFHRSVISENISALLTPSQVSISVTVPAVGSLPFPKEGVLLSVFIDFIEECGGAIAFERLTTTDVNNKFQKPLTYAHCVSYCGLLKKRGSHKVGTASVFISHAWKYRFMDVVDALTNHFKDSGDVFIWFDMFSNNQHAAPDLPFDWWCTTFKSAIEQFGHTVMILSPWHGPIPLTRAWCLFELYCTADTKSRFEVVMSPSDEEAFIAAIKEDCHNELNKMLATIDVRACEAWNPEDRRCIFKVVESLGCDRINMMVFELMRDWVLETTRRYMDATTSQNDRLSLVNALGTLYHNQGKFEQALLLFLECLQLSKEVLGERHPDTLAYINNLAGLYKSQGRYEEALPLYEQCLQLSKEVLGERHPDTLSSINNLAGLYYSQGRYEEALPLYEQCLQLRKKVLGERHPDTLSTINNLAGLYESQGRYEEALPLYEQCLQLSKEVLGERHPSTIIFKKNLDNIKFRI